MEKSVNEEQVKRDHLSTWQEKGFDPFPSQVERDCDIASTKEKVDQEAKIAGRIMSFRRHGKSTFADLQDESGKIQLYFKADNLNENYEQLDLLDTGDFISVAGEIFVTKMGETTLMVRSFALISKSLEPLPASWFGLKDVETRFRRRFLDLLVNEKAKETLKIRAKVISFFRKYMESEGFLELETPILQPIPGGASAKPFVTHYNILEHDFFLRIAPELYLKRLVVGGFEKVYEIGRAFRNEGLSHMHNPEFTIFEFYWAYKDYQFLMDFSEKMICQAIEDIKGSREIEYQGKTIKFEPPFPRITLRDLILQDCQIDIDQHKDFDSLKQAIGDQGIDLRMEDIFNWAKLVDELYKKVSRPKIWDPIFVIDYPSELIPLAKKKADDQSKVAVFQLVCGGGVEVIKAYNELNDPIDQKNRLMEQAKMREDGWEEGQWFDGNFVDALEVGMPPTAGWGMGIDRFLMLLTDNYSIKEVIPFPTLRPLENEEGISENIV
ncbi:MAG: Lysine--tRNA ligase [candidate division WS2 bacterium ADurb.Bin280]|uniref:Lysine--tRNA ligase n=1 Tax=candidate division WS2 bacterium ADurb.Bin280 TaxID=1852829 RepID=A0A1V5SCF7_9BACT|nr:MAG: Lysine--tRNA ligase [candidate division WS2 bacterium ADurb.Bin280]